MKRYDFEYWAPKDRYLVLDRRRGHEKYDVTSRALAECRNKDDAERIVDLLNEQEARG